ncbi:MAG: undecaprenyl-phosphate glucose phosphotransferase [Pseudomonadota bacterium]
MTVENVPPGAPHKADSPSESPSDALGSMDAAPETRDGSPLGLPRKKQMNVQLMGGLLRFADILTILLVGLAIYWFYPRMPHGLVPERHYQIALLAGSVLTLLAFSRLGLYTAGSILGRFSIGRAVAGWFATVFVLLVVAFALQISDSFSRVWVVSWMIITPLALSTVRNIVSFQVKSMAKDRQFALRTVIFGAGDYGRRLARHLKEQNDPMTEIVGFVDDRTNRVPHTCEGYEVLGNTDRLIEMVRNQEIDQVLVALPWGAKSRLDTLIADIGVTPVSILLAPDVGGFLPKGRSITTVADVPMLHILDRPFSGWAALIKDIEDRVLASLFILAALPVLAAVALAIKLDSKGPIIFKQRRFGFNNQEILIWKFRSMYVDDCDTTGTKQATKDDPRITRVGKLLRKTSLDELPQLFNVLRGEMSIVGPRPHAVSTKIGDRLFSELVERYDARHKVKPGITGWAQVNGWRGETDTVEKIQKRVEYDLHYIENWSVWLDVYIIFKTVWLVFKDEQAY